MTVAAGYLGWAKMEKPKRLKIFLMSPDDIMRMFNKKWACLATSYLTIESPVQIPDDAIVERVSYDFNRNSFCLMVSHESFDEVQPGSNVPIASEDHCRVTANPIMQSDREQALRAELEKARDDIREWSMKCMKLVSKVSLADAADAVRDEQ